MEIMLCKKLLPSLLALFVGSGIPFSQTTTFAVTVDKVTNIPFLAFSARMLRGVLWNAQASLRAPLRLIIRNPRIFRYA
jgi:hypothetical protein